MSYIWTFFLIIVDLTMPDMLFGLDVIVIFFALFLMWQSCELFCPNFSCMDWI